MRLFLAGLPGLEPGKAGPESAVLPLHHSPVHCSKAVQSYSFFPVSKYFGIFFALIRLKKRNDSAKRATFNFLTTFVKSD